MTHHFIIVYDFGDLPICLFGAVAILALTIGMIAMHRRGRK